MALIGLPVFVAPGTIEQMLLGLMICFGTMVVYAGTTPFLDFWTNLLAGICQVQIFFALLMGIFLKFKPEAREDGVVGIILTISLAVPFVCAILFSFQAFAGVASMLASLLGLRPEQRTRSLASRLRKRARQRWYRLLYARSAVRPRIEPQSWIHSRVPALVLPLLLTAVLYAGDLLYIALAAFQQRSPAAGFAACWAVAVDKSGLADDPAIFVRNLVEQARRDPRIVSRLVADMAANTGGAPPAVEPGPDGADDPAGPV